jgi:hypothetical protein
MAGSAHDAGSLWKGSLITGVANAVINGAIQAWLLRDEDVLLLTEGPWAITLHSVAGKAAMMATLLAIILTMVGHLQWKGPKRPFWPATTWLSARHGLQVLALVAIPSLIWQLLVGSIEVSANLAVAILAVVAGAVAAATHASTIVAFARTADGAQ